MEQIVFLDRDTIAPQISLTPPDFPHQWQEYPRTSPEQVVERLQQATIVINNKVPLRAEVLQHCPNVKLIAMAATGYDCVDIDYCRERGIAVANIRGYAVNTVPEHAFTLMLALRRSLAAYQQDVKEGEWQKSGQFCFFHHPVHDLAGSTLLLVGTGSIGSKMKRLAEAFDMRVLLAERKGVTEARPGYTLWEQALAEADVISLHCPLTVDTRHLIDADAFALMKKRPVLINTARGNIVDEEALEAALLSGQISAAGFDVAAIEPAPTDSLLVRLTRLHNFILTPHIAWASEQAQQTLADQLIANIEHFMAGEPHNRVV